MSRRTHSILAVIVVLVLGAGVFNLAMAVQATTGERSFTVDAKQVAYDEPVGSPKLLERDLEADAPTFSQVRDTPPQCMNENYPGCPGYGNLGGGS